MTIVGIVARATAVSAAAFFGDIGVRSAAFFVSAAVVSDFDGGG